MQAERKITNRSEDIRKTAIGRDTPNAATGRRVMFLGAVDAAVFTQDECVRVFIRKKCFQLTFASNSPNRIGRNIAKVDLSLSVNDDAPAFVRADGLSAE
jgi:hypothetical protein